MDWDGLDRSPRWIALAKQAAEGAGFRKVPWPLTSGSFGLEGEVSPYVEVRFQRVTDTNVAPEIFLGLYVVAFEREWGDRLKRTFLPEGYDEPPPFLLHALNIDCLCPRPWPTTSPSDQEVAELRQYLNRAFEYARGFPSNLDGLVAAIRADRLGEHKIWSYSCHPVKVRGFVQWLRRVHGVDVGECLLPGLMDMTDPYNVEVMLGPN